MNGRCRHVDQRELIGTFRPYDLGEASSIAASNLDCFHSTSLAGIAGVLGDDGLTSQRSRNPASVLRLRCRGGDHLVSIDGGFALRPLDAGD